MKIIANIVLGISTLFATEHTIPVGMTPLKLPSREEISCPGYDGFELDNNVFLVPKDQTQKILWSTTSGENYLELKSLFDSGTKQWVIKSWDDRKEVKVTIGKNMCLLLSGELIKRFTRFDATVMGHPQIKQEQTILNPTYKLYVFYDEGNNTLRILVENPYAGSPRLTASNSRVCVKIMDHKGQILGPEILSFEQDTKLALVSVSTKAGYLNIPTGRDLLAPVVPSSTSSVSVSFDLTASDGSAQSVSPRSGVATSSSPRSAGFGGFTKSQAGSPRIEALGSSSLSSSFERVSAMAGGSPRRSPRTPGDYKNLIFWRPTAHPGTPSVYYFGRQAARDEEIEFINQSVRHLTSEADVRFTNYLGPWDLFTS